MAPPEQNPPAEGDSEALGVLLERALIGDEEAPRLLVTLLQTRHYERLIDALRKFPQAHTQTVEDVFQDTIIGLMEKIRTGELRDLAPDDRKDFLKYFQRVLNGALRNVVRERKSPVLSRDKVPLSKELSEEVVDQKIRIPGESGQTEHLALINGAVSKLDPENARLLKMYREGVSYVEMARITGKKEQTLRNDIKRIKQDLLLDILPKSATAQLNSEAQERHSRRWPTHREIEDAIAALPPTIKDAVVFVHIETRSVDELAKTLGDRGDEKAASRLKQAYRTLSFKLKVPFPEAFEKASP